MAQSERDEYPDISIGQELLDDAPRVLPFPGRPRHPSPSYNVPAAEAADAGLPNQTLNPLDLLEDVRPRFVGRVNGGRTMNVRTPEELEDAMDRFLAGPEAGDYKTRSDLFRSGAWLLVLALTGKWQLRDPYLLSVLIEGEMQAQADWIARWEDDLIRYTENTRKALVRFTVYEAWDEIRRVFNELDAQLKVHPNDWRRQHYQIAVRDLPIVRVLILLFRARGWPLPLFLAAAPALPGAAVEGEVV